MIPPEWCNPAMQQRTEDNLCLVAQQFAAGEMSYTALRIACMGYEWAHSKHYHRHAISMDTLTYLELTYATLLRGT